MVPASPVAPTLPKVLISAAKLSPSPSFSLSLPSFVALPSPMETSGPTRASLSGRDCSPQSIRGSDVSQASCSVCSLPTRTGAPRLASFSGSTATATAVAAAAPTPIVTVPATVSSIMAPSVPVDPASVTSASKIDSNVGDQLDHTCVRCSQCRQKCTIPEGCNPLNMSELCLRCVHNKKVYDWTREAVGALSVFFILSCCGWSALCIQFSNVLWGGGRQVFHPTG